MSEVFVALIEHCLRGRTGLSNAFADSVDIRLIRQREFHFNFVAHGISLLSLVARVGLCGSQFLREQFQIFPGE